ncbi:hypothetical protein A0H81_14047 [Grifola frondosa]|uniref:Uncharacterized protein n=1 Tax=Grifola frondosa TaxID=5627 RepID=A0A1C7LMX8_GRIFR|nr:hypothetical protein A0H81_14047 [Grifola frondosa]
MLECLVDNDMFDICERRVSGHMRTCATTRSLVITLPNLSELCELCTYATAFGPSIHPLAFSINSVWISPMSMAAAHLDTQKPGLSIREAYQLHYLQIRSLARNATCRDFAIVSDAAAHRVFEG